MPQDKTNQPNSPGPGPSPNDPDTPRVKTNRNPKNKSPRSVIGETEFFFRRGISIANGAAEISEIRRLNTVIEQHSTSSQRNDRLGKRDLFTSTEAQVREIKEFMTRNRDEIRSVDHYNVQLTLHAKTAIDFANESRFNDPEDALTRGDKEAD